MQIIWKDSENFSNPLLKQSQFCLNGLTIRRLSGPAGEAPEYTHLSNSISLPLKGEIFTRRNTLSGKLQSSIGNSSTMCVIPTGQTVYACWKADYEALFIDLSTEFLQQTARNLNLSENIELMELVLPKDEFIQNIALILLDELPKQENSSSLYLESLAQTLTLHIFKNYANLTKSFDYCKGGLSGAVFRRVKEFITQNLEQKLMLSEIARVGGLSEFHFARAFRLTAGETLNRFVMRQRIEKAKELLSETDLPLVEICFRTGFRTQSHFTTIFRQHTLLTPQNWRKNYRIKSTAILSKSSKNRKDL